jgi:serine/threonine-protein phosphatase 6 regulatory subunit 3
MVDLIMRIVAVDDMEDRRTTLNWLIDQGFLTQLIEKLHPQYEIGFHINASQILVDMINMSNSNSHRVLQQLAQKEIAQAILSQCLHEDSSGTASAMVHGLLVLIVLTNHLKNSDQYSDLLDTVLKVIEHRLGDIVDFLEAPLPYNEELTTPGGRIRRFGVERVKICEFIELLFCIEHTEFNSKLCESHVLNVLLSCMVNYPWNNFLHVHVNNIIDTIIGYPMQDNYHPIVEVNGFSQVSHSSGCENQVNLSFSCLLGLVI